MTVRGADAGHLQAIQSQEMDRSAADLVPAVACLAVVAGRPGPRQPRHPHAAEPGFLWRRRTFKSDPLFWFLPRETYLITVKEDDVVDLGTYTRKVLPSSAAGGSPRANPQPDRRRWPSWSDRCTSARSRIAT